MSHEVVQSGFFTNEVLGHLRPTAQIIQWDLLAPNPSGRRHVESGSYRKTAHLQNCGGFTAQQESGVALDFGSRQIPGGGSGFTTSTVAITFNMGELNKNPRSRFDQLFNNGSGTGSEDLTAFNFRLWMGELSAFNDVAYSGASKTPVSVKPVFHYRESAEWRGRYELELLESSGVGSGTPTSGVNIVPSGMPDCPNVFSRGDEVMVSGAFIDREFSNFVYMRGFFPDLPSGQLYKLGTYGGLGENTFTTKFSYDYTRRDSNIIDPTDTKDFALSIIKEFPVQTLNEGLSGWWQMNESSPKLSQLSGFQPPEVSANEATMTLSEFVEGGGTVGRHTGIVSSGTASGFAMDLRSNRRDQVYTSTNDVETPNFDGSNNDGDVGFTFTGWIALNDPSGTDPAATGVGARIPDLNTGVLCRWNFRFALSNFQYRCWYDRSIGRFVWQVRNKDSKSPQLPYNYMHVDARDNGHHDATDFDLIQGTGGGVEKHSWYFLAFGYNPTGEGSPGGDLFFRINDGPIDHCPLGSDVRSINGVAGTPTAPFSIGSWFTRTVGNGSIGPGAGQYDNWTLHRKALNNKEMLDMYAAGRGQEFPVGLDRSIDFNIPPEQAIIEVDPDPVPLRRALKAFYNFSEASGCVNLADAQQYADLIPNNSQSAGGAISGQMMPTSGIIIDSMPNFDDLASASGALQIRDGGGTGFDDGQIGNNVWWETTTSSQMSKIGQMDMTFITWVKFKRSGSDEGIMAQWSETGNNRWWRIRKTSDDHIRFDRANGNTVGKPAEITTPAGFPVSFATDRWYFIFVTGEMTGGIGSNDMTWQLNVFDPILNETFSSSQVSSFQWADITTTPAITFGAYDTLGTAVVGDVDLAAAGMWRRKLLSSEITSFINSGKGLNFGASNFGKIQRVYWDSQLRRDGDSSTI